MISSGVKREMHTYSEGEKHGQRRTGTCTGNFFEFILTLIRNHLISTIRLEGLVFVCSLRNFILGSSFGFSLSAISKCLTPRYAFRLYKKNPEDTPHFKVTSIARYIANYTYKLLNAVKVELGVRGVPVLN